MKLKMKNKGTFLQLCHSKSNAVTNKKLSDCFIHITETCTKSVLQGTHKFSQCGVCWFYASASAFCLQRRLQQVELSCYSCLDKRMAPSCWSEMSQPLRGLGSLWAKFEIRISSSFPLPRMACDPPSQCMSSKGTALGQAGSDRLCLDRGMLRLFWIHRDNAGDSSLLVF